MPPVVVDSLELPELPELVLSSPELLELVVLSPVVLSLELPELLVVSSGPVLLELLVVSSGPVLLVPAVVSAPELLLLLLSVVGCGVVVGPGPVRVVSLGPVLDSSAGCGAGSAGQAESNTRQATNECEDQGVMARMIAEDASASSPSRPTRAR